MNGTRVWIAGSGLAVAVSLFAATAATVARLDLPSELKNYRAWQPLLKEPRPVPMELWLRCAAPTEADWSAAREKSGPHTRYLIMVYGNGASPRADSGKRVFAPGAVLAKEKLLKSGGTPEGVAFMVKRPEPRFRDTGGWEFLYFPSAGDPRRTHEECAACHRSAASRDYVFGEYP